MAEPRLKAKLWVQAALRMGDLSGRPGAVLRRGDPDSGSVLVVVRAPAGVVVLTPVRAGEGQPAWLRATGADAVGDQTADSYVARHVARDPDVWVIEFSGPDLTPPFEAKLL